MKDITVYQEMVTPEKAREWLKMNLEHNRAVKDRYVSQLAGDISEGRWRLTGDTIKFDTKGHLVDGQHRLNAVIVSGKSVPMMIVKNVAVGTEKIIDQGNKRTISDILAIQGESQVTGIGAVLTTLCFYDGKRFRANDRVYWPSNGEKLELLREYPRVSEIVHRVKQDKRYKRLGFPAQIAAVWVLAELKAPGQGDQFFEALADVNTKPNTQAFALRERLLNARLLKSSRLLRFEALAVIVKSWNAYRSGKLITHLRWNASGPKAEPFPVMI